MRPKLDTPRTLHWKFLNKTITIRIHSKTHTCGHYFRKWRWWSLVDIWCGRRRQLGKRWIPTSSSVSRLLRLSYAAVMYEFSLFIRILCQIIIIIRGLLEKCPTLSLILKSWWFWAKRACTSQPWTFMRMRKFFFNSFYVTCCRAMLEWCSACALVDFSVQVK